MPDKKHLAFCLSGEMRFLEEGYKLHKKLIDFNSEKYNTDVFIHTWYDESMEGQPFQRGYEAMKGAMPKGAKELALSLYKPKVFVFEPRKTFNISGLSVGPYSVFPENMVAMFYGIDRVLRLKFEYEHAGFLHDEYDLTIRARFDAGFINPIDLSDLDPERLHVHNKPKHTPYSVSDLFAVGNTTNMIPYSLMYRQLRMYNEPPHSVPLCGEVVLGYGLQDMKVPVQEHNWSGNLTIIRG